VDKIIFVVDDNDFNLVVVKEALKNQYRVMTLPSAEKMFSLIEKITPDLILLDIEMPEMDGFEALECLKSKSAFANIPIIFLTATIDETIKNRGKQLGVNEFFIKPFTSTDMIMRVNAFFESRNK